MASSSEPLSETDAHAVAPARWLLWSLVLAPAILFYALLLRLGTAAPIIDDFWQIIGYALAWKSAAGAAAKWGLLLHTQVGPYKPIFEEAVVDLQLMFGGRLHFSAMVVLSDLTVLGVFAILWKNMPHGIAGRGRILRMLPVSLLLFSMNYAENLDWAGCALAQLTVLLFVFAAFHFLTARAAGWGSFAAACGFGLLAGLCFTNGLVLWPVGLLYLAMQFRSPRWSAAKLLVWTACATVSTWVFLDGNAGTGISARVSLWKEAVFLLSFFGGGLENMHHKPVPYLSVMLGAVMLGVFVHAVWTRYDKRNPFFFWTMIWMLLTACGVANSRVSMGLQMALSSRYKIYCDLLLIFCYVYGLDRREPQGAAQGETRGSWWYVRACAAAAFLFCVGADVSGSRFLHTRQTRAEDAMRAYLADPEHASPMFLVEDVLSPGERSVEDHARQQTNQARGEGVYLPPPADRLGLF